MTPLVHGAAAGIAASLGGLVFLICHGLSSRRDQFPHVVRLWRSGSTCTGVLIAPRVVLTAGRGHCLTSSGDAINVAATDWMDGQQGRVAALHDALDLGLVALPRPPMRRRSTVAELAADVVWPATGRVLVVGYGRTVRDEPRAGVSIRYPAFGEAAVRDVTPTTFETWGPQVACEGDSGGPAFLPGSRVAVGIVSRAAGRVECGAPAQYVRVDRPEVRRWILDGIAQAHA